jgi:hypothetical protein
VVAIRHKTVLRPRLDQLRRSIWFVHEFATIPAATSEFFFTLPAIDLSHDIGAEPLQGNPLAPVACEEILQSAKENIEVAIAESRRYPATSSGSLSSSLGVGTSCVWR